MAMFLNKVENDKCGEYNVTGTLDDGSGLSLFHSNIRSIENNFDALETLLFRINCNIHFIGLTETWFRSASTGIKLSGYNLEQGSNNLNKCSGVSLFIRKDVLYNVVGGFNCAVSDSVFVEIDCSVGGKLLVGLFYRSDAFDVDVFLNYWANLLEAFVKGKKNVILLGDFNINVKEVSSETVQNFLEISNLWGFRQLISGITRPSGNDDSTIDLCFTNIVSSTRSYIVQSQLSDHFPTISFFNEFLINESVLNRSQGQDVFDKYCFLRMARGTSFNDVLTSENVDDGVNILVGKIKSCIEKSTIKRTFFRRYFFSKQPWISLGILKCLKKRDKMKNKLNRDNLNDNLRNRYRLYRNMLNMVICTAKRRYFADRIKDAGSDSAIIWESIKKVIGNDGGNGFPSQLIARDGNIVFEKKEILDEFNNYFTDLGNQGLNGNRDPCENIPSFSKSIFFSPVTDYVVAGIIRGMKPKKSKCLDGLSNFIIKLAAPFIIPSITHLINIMFSSGVFPTAFKKARVRMVFKSGNKNFLKNYRPIAVLSPIGKIFEKVIHQQLYDFLEVNSLLSGMQFGFRRNLGTDNAVSSLVDFIYEALNKRNFVGMISLDVKKAFDSVNHALLLRKLDKLGIRGVPLCLIKSYLIGRLNLVEDDGIKSAFKVLSAGVPQGSILGPLFFVIFMNDLENCVGNSHSVLYADDTAVCVNDICVDSLIGTLQDIINKFVDWFHCNGLSLNGDKSKFIIFSSPGRRTAIDFRLHTLIIDINGTFLVPCETLVYLGVVLDRCLKWLPHIAFVKNKLSRVVGIFYRLRILFNKSILMSVFHALFQSVIGYCILCYGSTHSSKLKGLLVMQKKVLRVINFMDRRQSVSHLFNQENILTVYSLNIKAIALVTFKIISGLLKNCDNILVPNVPSNMYNLRRQCVDPFIIPGFLNDYGRFSRSVRYPLIVNFLNKNGCCILKSWSVLNLKKVIKKCLVSIPTDAINGLF